jgi:hypothetical protein
MKVPIVTTKDYIIYLEEDEGFTFIHCDVLVRWSKKVKRQLKQSFDKITKKVNKSIYALHEPNDKKHEKFLNLFGFTYFKHITGLDGRGYHIYVWR